MSKLVLQGSVDFKGRPLVRLSFIGLDDSVLSQVDTGCNVFIVDASDFVRTNNFKKTPYTEDAFNIENELITFDIYKGQIDWFDKQLMIPIHVPQPRQDPNAIDREKRKIFRDGDPILVVGTMMLRFSVLTIDFRACTLTIERHNIPEQEYPI